MINSSLQTSPEEISSRQLKASEVVRQALADIFLKRKYFDSYLFDKSITISRVKISADLKHAIIYVFPFGEIDQKQFKTSLDNITPLIRKELTKKINFKFSPMLVFYLDENFDYAEKMEKLFHNME
jgi:ribosome-binding factor A